MTSLLRVAMGVLVLNAICQAGVIYNLDLDTSGLVVNGNGPFALGFQLTSGDTTSGVVNTALLSIFAFGGGGAQGVGRLVSKHRKRFGGSRLYRDLGYIERLLLQ